MFMRLGERYISCSFRHNNYDCSYGLIEVFRSTKNLSLKDRGLQIFSFCRNKERHECLEELNFHVCVCLLIQSI